MSTAPKPTVFWGPNHPYYDLAQWPWPFNIHLQLHDMLPGDLWTDADGILLQQKRILTPTGTPGNFRLGDNPWFYQYRHIPGQFRLVATWFRTVHDTYILNIVHLTQRFSYNQIQSPTGVFAYGGYATLAWEAL